MGVGVISGVETDFGVDCWAVVAGMLDGVPACAFVVLPLGKVEAINPIVLMITAMAQIATTIIVP